MYFVSSFGRKEGEWQSFFNLDQNLSVSDLKLFYIQKYNKLSSKEYWKIIKEVEDLMIFWLYYEEIQTGKEFKLGIISKMKSQEAQTFVKKEIKIKCKWICNYKEKYWKYNI